MLERLHFVYLQIDNVLFKLCMCLCMCIGCGRGVGRSRGGWSGTQLTVMYI